MKTRTFRLSHLIIIILILLVTQTCKKDEITTKPTVISDSVGDITEHTATCGGNITDNGGAIVTVKGVCWDISNKPTIANNKTSDDAGVGAFTSSITGLIDNTTYYVRAYATNSAGTAYGEGKSFTTLVATVPTVTTGELTDIRYTTATCGGEVVKKNGFEVSTSGVCWATTTTPTIIDNKTIDGTGIGIFTSKIADLEYNTTYYVRAYATNSAGTAYGEGKSFTTLDYTSGTVIDYDGNMYNHILIGNQVWISENLKTTHYADGTSIPLVKDNAEWAELGFNDIDKAYCYYNNSDANRDIFGALYTYAAATNSDNDDTTQGVCPTGWHLPSDAEWKELEMYLGMSQNEADDIFLRGTNVGSKLAGNASLWNGSIENNIEFGKSGFTALPGGYRSNKSDGVFHAVSYAGYWWSATQYNVAAAWDRALIGGYNTVYRIDRPKSMGFSVRCLRDN